MIVVRLALVYPASWLPRLSARVRERDPFPGWRRVTVIGWAGMRGVVTLALALAIPTEVEGGGPFPDRNLVVFLAFSVIVVTLVGQGLTLPLVIRRLGVGPTTTGPAGDGRRALARLSEVALDHLDALDPEADGVPAELVERLRERYRARLAHLDQQRRGRHGPPDGSRAYAELVHDLLGAQREELRRLREQGASRPRWPAASTTTWTPRRPAWSANARLIPGRGGVGQEAMAQGSGPGERHTDQEACDKCR